MGQVAIVHRGDVREIERSPARPITVVKAADLHPGSSHMPGQVDVKLGEEWLVVTCHNDSCGGRILIDPVGPDMRDDEGALILPADTVLVLCPHCELESLYLSDEIRCEQGKRRH
jgi:hypothetical protein